MNNVDILEQQVFAARKKLSTQEQLMVNDYVENNAVSPVAAWLLWVFLGQFVPIVSYLRSHMPL